MAQLKIKDYEHILDLVTAVLQNGDPDASWHLISRELFTVMRANTVIMARMCPSGRTGVAEAWAPEWLGREVGELLRRRLQQGHPLIPYLQAREHSPRRMTDLCETWRKSAWYNDALRTYGTKQQLGVPLPGEPGGLRAIVFGREGEFGERDFAFACRVQPLLMAVDNHLRELRRLRAAAGADSPVGDIGLTPREATVLGLLAEGLTTEAIGRRLAISPHTVNRHLEKVYRKLGANNRVTATARARAAGLVG
ncbi:LuxR C-terminal-related transcriptional regulator [Streptomyces sp. ET3-23]|uniref:helix-turn-helix transcriptional regulator n=1 Tax=Streptomyces sp. ET3-23 TaxID=2885643 RepID=UPI001D11E38D|nr:LuxR C-terminal-related transcriptional regulator [Streptomyces sp. ET3-23]MCC2276910.1 LuxR C-terminal-related transcriptional regulator [Streptomyces sp. ET3-23]